MTAMQKLFVHHGTQSKLILPSLSSWTEELSTTRNEYAQAFDCKSGLFVCTEVLQLNLQGSSRNF